jgi:hypothetical protein
MIRNTETYILIISSSSSTSLFGSLIARVRLWWNLLSKTIPFHSFYAYCERHSLIFPEISTLGSFRVNGLSTTIRSIFLTRISFTRLRPATGSSIYSSFWMTLTSFICPWPWIMENTIRIRLRTVIR